ncbi:MAG: hypothetical protein HY881_27665 [Deltaproteobacteria bacterium]|nr:hypothetical protein [Deltaproteobacteria bacterium]
MPIKILYVENNSRDYKELKDAADEFNKIESNDQLLIYRALDPDEMKGLLGPQFNVILADVYFNDPNNGDEDTINRLSDIIKYVNEWCETQSKGALIPVIAYTGRASLDQCLVEQENLYDIWDKNTTNTKYVIWRLSNLSLDVSRYHPDAFLQNLIRNMKTGSKWHDKVKEMTAEYDSALTEYDQISKVDDTIGLIANNFDTENICSEMWEVMERSEAITRALSKNVRGHARHAINVYWFGYFILNSANVSSFAENYWKSLLINRPNMAHVNNENYVDALNNIWFYAGLFHDIGINVEKSDMQYEHQLLLKKHFDNYALPLPNLEEFPLKTLSHEICNLINEIDGKEIGKNLTQVFLNSMKDNKPDHGLVAATYFLNNINANEVQKIYAKEAARSTLLHNIISKEEFKDMRFISWDNDFITCLLMLCDQLQTWDRERGDTRLIDEDKPERAELKNLFFVEENGKCKLSIFINYIAPAHVVRHPYYNRKLLKNLNKVILTKLNKALKRIKQPWPFEVYVNLSLGRKSFYEYTYK